MALSVSYQSTVTVTEQLTDADLASNGKIVTHSGNSTAGTFTGTTTPPVTARGRLNYAMTDGAATIDLRALIGTNAAVVDGNGLRAQFIKLTNPSNNANPITIAKGAVNGYDGLGDDFSITLAPGGELLVKLNDGGSDIGANNKTLDIAGVGTQAVVGEVVMG